jgi:hypothetical protein
VKIDFAIGKERTAVIHASAKNPGHPPERHADGGRNTAGHSCSVRDRNAILAGIAFHDLRQRQNAIRLVGQRHAIARPLIG